MLSNHVLDLCFVWMLCYCKCCRVFTRGLVSKETVVLRWGRETQNFGFINRVDKVNWPIYLIISIDKSKIL